MVHTKLEEIPCQKIHLSPRLPPKVIFKNAWQIQHEDHVGKVGGHETMMEREIAFRIQGISRAEVEQEEEESETVHWKTCECNHES